MCASLTSRLAPGGFWAAGWPRADCPSRAQAAGHPNLTIKAPVIGKIADIESSASRAPTAAPTPTPTPTPTPPGLRDRSAVDALLQSIGSQMTISPPWRPRPA